VACSQVGIEADRTAIFRFVLSVCVRLKKGQYSKSLSFHRYAEATIQQSRIY